MNLAFALTTDQRWESARAEYERALAIDPSCQLAKARLDELNTLVAKRESAAGARRDPATLTTETATAAPPVPPGSDSPTAPPEQPTAGVARRDPALRTTAAVVSRSPGQQYRPMTRVAIPPLPAESGAMARLWSSAAAPPPRPATVPPAPPGRPDAHPQRDAALPVGSASAPLLAIDSPRPAPARTRRPIPTPRPFPTPDPVAIDPTSKSTVGP